MYSFEITRFQIKKIPPLVPKTKNYPFINFNIKKIKKKKKKKKKSSAISQKAQISKDYGDKVAFLIAIFFFLVPPYHMLKTTHHASNIPYPTNYGDLYCWFIYSGKFIKKQ